MKTVTMGIMWIMMAAQTVKLTVTMFAIVNLQSVIGVVETVSINHKWESNAIMEIQRSMMAAQIIVKLSKIGSVPKIIQTNFRYVCQIAEMELLFRLFNSAMIKIALTVMAVRIVKSIVSIFVRVSHQFAIGAAEIKFINLKWENNATMEIQQSMMGVRTVAKFFLIGIATIYKIWSQFVHMSLIAEMGSQLPM